MRLAASPYTSSRFHAHKLAPSFVVFRLGVLVSRVKEQELQNITNKLVEYVSGKDERLRDIASLGALCCCACISHPLTVPSSHLQA